MVGTSSASNKLLAEELGADLVLLYRECNIVSWAHDSGRQFDIIVECVGDPTLKRACKCARDEGLIIVVAMSPDLKKPVTGVSKGVRSVFFSVEANSKQIDAIANYIESGKCRPLLDNVYDLRDYKAAFERANSGYGRRKAVLVL
jgi:NADPH:quinone reductase-like Zn-dependent oxidoreductase